MIKLLVIVGSILLAASLHVFFMLRERVDVLEQDIPFVKNELNSQDCSLQTVRLIPTKQTGNGKK